LRRELCDVARSLYDRGHNAPGDGNLSARLSERYLLCTPSQVHKGRLSPEQIVKVRMADGEGVDGTPSSEIRMHLAIYEIRGDVGAIAHAHSPNAVGLTVAGRSLEQPAVPEAIQQLGAVPTVPYTSPTTADVATAVLPYVVRYNAFILERHGPVALGENLEQATSRLEVVEHTARITVAGMASGGAEPIPEDEAMHLRQMAEQAGVLRSPDAAPKANTRLRADEQKLVDELAERVLQRLRSGRVG
jgi:L-fuculose-phosphate aldolase